MLRARGGKEASLRYAPQGAEHEAGGVIIESAIAIVLLVLFAQMSLETYRYSMTRSNLAHLAYEGMRAMSSVGVTGNASSAFSGSWRVAPTLSLFRACSRNAQSLSSGNCPSLVAAYWVFEIGNTKRLSIRPDSLMVTTRLDSSGVMEIELQAEYLGKTPLLNGRNLNMSYRGMYLGAEV